jgi:hypothetical protein
LIALARKGQEAFREGRATGSAEGVHELLRLAYVRAEVAARAQAVSSRLACQEAASRQYRHPATCSHTGDQEIAAPMTGFEVQPL